MSTATATTRSAQTGFGRLLLVGLAVGLVAAVVNLIIFFVGSALGVPFVALMGADQPLQELSAGMFIGASIVPALLGAVFYGLLGRFTKRGTTIFLAVSAVFALLSLGGPLTMPVPLSTKLVLSLLHLITAAIIAYGLTRYARQG
jgi:hypothetical protein